MNTFGDPEQDLLKNLLTPYRKAMAGAPMDMAKDPLLGSLFQPQPSPQQQGGRSPQGQGGGGVPPGGDSLLELIYGGNQFNPSSSDDSHPTHLHVASENPNKMLKWIDNRPGFEVSENPRYGGVAPVHSENSYHYSKRAGDVNYQGGGRFGGESQALNWLEHQLMRRYGL